MKTIKLIFYILGLPLKVCACVFATLIMALVGLFNQSMLDNIPEVWSQLLERDL